jgi:glycosyltransferase involved in cell wall biosynthesis
MNPCQNSRPLVSLILLSYNQENFIKLAVEGALAQTYNPLEIIISDDCSPDRTFARIEEAVEGYKGPHKIIVNRNAVNLGLGAHFQRAFDLSHGEWIVAAAGDDISEAHRVMTLVSATSNGEHVVAVGSWYSCMDASGSPIPGGMPIYIQNGRIDRKGEESWVRRFRCGGDIGIPGLSAMWSRSLFQEFGPIPGDVVAEDLVLGFRSYLSGCVVYIHDKLVRYRIHEENACGFQMGDPVQQELRKAAFAEKARPCLYQCMRDLESYTKRHGEDAVPKGVSKLLEVSLFMNQARIQWWKKGVVWKLATLMRILANQGSRPSRWFVKRLVPLRVFAFLQTRNVRT